MPLLRLYVLLFIEIDTRKFYLFGLTVKGVINNACALRATQFVRNVRSHKASADPFHLFLSSSL